MCIRIIKLLCCQTSKICLKSKLMVKLNEAKDIIFVCLYSV